VKVMRVCFRFGRTEMAVVFGGNRHFYKKKVLKMMGESDASVLSGRTLSSDPLVDETCFTISNRVSERCWKW
jgi:hypothetical protein